MKVVKRKQQCLDDFIGAKDADRNIMILKMTLENGAKEIVINYNALEKMKEIRNYYDDDLKKIESSNGNHETIDSYIFCDSVTESILKIIMQGCE